MHEHCKVLPCAEVIFNDKKIRVKIVEFQTLGYDALIVYYVKYQQYLNAIAPRRSSLDTDSANLKCQS